MLIASMLDDRFTQQEAILPSETTDTGTGLFDLLVCLKDQGYHFVPPTPLTHSRVTSRRRQAAVDNLRDVFGWNLPFTVNDISPELFELMRRADILQGAGDQWRSDVRVASVGDDLFIHSAYPSAKIDSVFFGPDTYRFTSFIRQSLRTLYRQKRSSDEKQSASMRVLDIGCGSGAGGVAAARVLQENAIDATLIMSDINELALRYTAINARIANLPITLAQGDAMAAIDGEFDLIICNPPYLDDDAQRAYRHGGDRLGRALGLRMAREALAQLAPGGMLLLYTGVAIVDGKDMFLTELLPMLVSARCNWSYIELDPDVFGEELDRPVYAHAERIAAVGLLATRTPPSEPYINRSGDCARYC